MGPRPVRRRDLRSACARHAISLGDFQRALGGPSQEQIAELQVVHPQGDDKARQFAAAALGQAGARRVCGMLPELLASPDPYVRRLAFQMAPPEAVTVEQLEAAAER